MPVLWKLWQEGDEFKASVEERELEKEKKEMSYALKRNHLPKLYKQHWSKMNICYIYFDLVLILIMSKQLWIYKYYVF